MLFHASARILAETVEAIRPVVKGDAFDNLPPVWSFCRTAWFSSLLIGENSYSMKTIYCKACFQYEFVQDYESWLI